MGKQTKYKCPKCSSKNIIIWEENIIEHFYHITIDGKQYKKPYKKEYKGSDIHSGLKCKDCNEYENFYNDEEIKKWLCN